MPCSVGGLLFIPSLVTWNIEEDCAVELQPTPGNYNHGCGCVGVFELPSDD